MVLFFFFQREDGIRDLTVTGVQTCVFFFQAEDGIRDLTVTGVQTCALPIDRKSTRLNSSHSQISYAVFCLRFDCDWSSDVCSSDRSEEHTSELQSQSNLVCRLLLGKKKHTSELQSQSNLVCRLLLQKKAFVKCVTSKAGKSRGSQTPQATPTWPGGSPAASHAAPRVTACL